MATTAAQNRKRELGRLERGGKGASSKAAALRGPTGKKAKGRNAKSSGGSSDAG